MIHPSSYFQLSPCLAQPMKWIKGPFPCLLNLLWRKGAWSIGLRSIAREILQIKACMLCRIKKCSGAFNEHYCPFQHYLLLTALCCVSEVCQSGFHECEISNSAEMKCATSSFINVVAGWKHVLLVAFVNSGIFPTVSTILALTLVLTTPHDLSNQRYPWCLWCHAFDKLWGKQT